MKSRPSLTLLAILAAFGCGWALSGRRSATPEPASTANTAATAYAAPAATERAASTQPPHPSPRTTPAIGIPEIELPLRDGGDAIEFLEDAGAAADFRRSDAVIRYLAHRDPEVRTAAREALMQIGGEGALAALKAAAEKAATPEEAAELRKAADFVALPSWTDYRREHAARPAETKK